MTPEFILDLRSKIGHAELWLPAVTAVVKRDDAVLLVRRSDNGAWTPVTGICDPREEPHLTAVRETEEETGVQVRVDRLVWVQSVGPVNYPNGDVTSYVDIAFACSPLPNSPEARVNDDENTAVGWFPVDSLPPMSPRFEHLIHAVFEGKTGFGSQNSQ